MKLLPTISFIQVLGVISLLITSVGCADDKLPQPWVCLPPEPPSHRANQLLDHVLQPAFVDILTGETFPQRAITLLQTAPSGENDSAYWQWYDRTLAATGATTEYRRDDDGAIFLSWNFATTDRQHNQRTFSGYLSLDVRERDNRLIVVVTAKAFTVGQSQWTGTYRSIWNTDRAPSVERQYTQLIEDNEMIVTEKCRLPL